MANSKKSQHFNIWQWEVNRLKELLNELQLQFVVDASAVEAPKSLQWSMLTNDSVSTGFSVRGFFLSPTQPTTSLLKGCTKCCTGTEPPHRYPMQ